MKESKLKHIDIIQSTISRMAQNSFTIKGWTITILVGLFVFLQKDNFRNNMIIYLVPIIFFWILDSYYLWQERLFRKLYNDVIVNVTEESDLSMNIIQYKNTVKFFSSLFSVSEIMVYLPLLLITLLLLCNGN
ncbi:hypothetical protein HMPREF9378_0017 [Streptococcus sanguinis SK1 = NCTC 7863]|jgi:hypothetical protein|uniref:Uncharacterized protein n=1 Tax=Streptococcus sanguinis SK405 TaxID=888817 RepID=A0ABC9PFB0_STRSA|nr:hypothetical protein [Streptococcus sanguinis]EGC25551.1 hypothetical protein HMPREF9390_0018 [Streptococcus sanguinis SK405]EGC26969.1 hypothetical protein HMPREF9392_1872 [Streptococcus sanguinis SK678]EGF09222.1 hypothetical protein HMPREF9378_0017 [Streptococcus sanguinis SK1 = NCTC 7863]MBZ2076184.1 hypothetical protein [Streptococcus sanguinis]SQG30876.1 Uncharacterised protein [Streptococcus sanguinis]